MLDKKIKDIHRMFLWKRRKSNGIFISLNIFAMFIAAGIVLLNLYAIRKNPAQNDTLIISLFVTTSTLSAGGAIISSLMSFFVFRKKANKAKEQADDISQQRLMWLNKEESYESKQRDQILIDRVLKILEK